jgi:hypothetical protein
MTRALLLALAGLALVPAAAAGEPITLAVSTPAVVASNVSFAVHVTVAADQGALGGAPLRVRVRAAGECGATFDSTPGVVLVDKPLGPSGKVSGNALTHTFGSFTACAFLEQQGDDRLYAFDDSTAFAVTHPCTTYSRRVIATRRALKRVRRQLRHAHGAHRAALTRRSAKLHRKLARANKGRQRACRA